MTSFFPLSAADTGSAISSHSVVTAAAAEWPAFAKALGRARASASTISSGGPRARSGVGVGGEPGAAPPGVESQGPPLAWLRHQATTSAIGVCPIMLEPASTMSPATSHAVAKVSSAWDWTTAALAAPGTAAEATPAASARSAEARSAGNAALTAAFPAASGSPLTTEANRARAAEDTRDAAAKASAGAAAGSSAEAASAEDAAATSAGACCAITGGATSTSCARRSSAASRLAGSAEETEACAQGSSCGHSFRGRACAAIAPAQAAAALLGPGSGSRSRAASGAAVIAALLEAPRRRHDFAAFFLSRVKASWRTCGDAEWSPTAASSDALEPFLVASAATSSPAARAAASWERQAARACSRAAAAAGGGGRGAKVALSAIVSFLCCLSVAGTGDGFVLVLVFENSLVQALLCFVWFG